MQNSGALLKNSLKNSFSSLQRFWQRLSLFAAMFEQ
jgi:hypothetical protein